MALRHNCIATRASKYVIEDEELLVVEPILGYVQGDNALVVDVATTGRVPRFCWMNHV